jgi:predicted porin
MRTVIGGLLAAGLLAGPAFAQSGATWNGLPDRFQIDAGYFSLNANTLLRLNGPAGDAGDVDFEDDLGLEDQVDTFWVNGRWRVGRRHQLELGFTQSSRDRANYTLERDFVWGGETYSAGLSASPESTAKILGGYYRFAAFRNERFEVGPTVGVGYLWLDARIRATGTVTVPGGGTESRSLDESASTGSITGAIGAYAEAWPAKRLVMRGDFLYIKVSPDDSEASVTDWRIAASYYFTKNVGVGVQYKYYQYSYDRGILVSQLGGELTFDGLQVFLTTRF